MSTIQTVNVIGWEGCILFGGVDFAVQMTFINLIGNNISIQRLHYFLFNVRLNDWQTQGSKPRHWLIQFTDNFGRFIKKIFNFMSTFK